MSVLEMAVKKMVDQLTGGGESRLNDKELRAVIAACQAVMGLHGAFEKIIMIDTGEA